MTDQPRSLQATALTPPNVPVAQVRRLVVEQYGFDGELDSLVSERDQNFRLTSVDGPDYVVKIANSAEDKTVTDFQIQALLHLEANACPVMVPRIVRTRSGAYSTSVSHRGSAYVLRVVSYVPGCPLVGTTPDVELARQLGRSLAEIDIALSNFEHPGDSQVLLWDMQRASELRGLMSHVEGAELQAIVCACLDDFQCNATPAFASLRSQIIHNDLSPGNVLVTAGERTAVAGVIDFGDMLRAPLIFDVAIAASYCRAEAEDALGQLVAFVAGFDAVTTLEDAELELLYDLVRMRIATTITLNVLAQIRRLRERRLHAESPAERAWCRAIPPASEQADTRAVYGATQESMWPLIRATPIWQ